MSMRAESSLPDEPEKSSSSDGDAEHWVLCDGCHKWRRVTGLYAAELDDDTPWYCRQNPDKKFASCEVPQEMTNEQIDEEDSEMELDKEMKPIGRLPVVWQLLKSNVFSHRKRKFQHEDDIMICHCAPVWRGGDGCGPDCINRLLNIECVAGFCPCEEKCSNQMFSQRRYAKLEVKRAGAKGFGLFAAQDIKAGQFIIEYIGEVLDEDEYMRRKDHYISAGQRHYYFMNVGNGEVIDAARKGNHARFINHSCEPNCETQKWVVQGELAIGLFALRDIPTGEELTFDYNFERYGDKPMRCYCNTRSCRRFIGGSQEVLGEDRIGEAYDVTNDMEPMMVTEGEVDFVVEAILNRSIGVTNDVAIQAMLRTLRHMCQQRGIVWTPTFVESPTKSPPAQQPTQRPQHTFLAPIKLALPKPTDQKHNTSLTFTNHTNGANHKQGSAKQVPATVPQLRIAAPQQGKAVQPVQHELKLKLKLNVVVKQEPQEPKPPPVQKAKDITPSSTQPPTPKDPPTPRELISSTTPPPAAADSIPPVAASPLPAFRGPLKAAFKQMKQLRQQSLQTPPPAPHPKKLPYPNSQHDTAAVEPKPQPIRHDPQQDTTAVEPKTHPVQQDAQQDTVVVKPDIPPIQYDAQQDIVTVELEPEPIQQDAQQDTVNLDLEPNPIQHDAQQDILAVEPAPQPIQPDMVVPSPQGPYTTTLQTNHKDSQQEGDLNSQDNLNNEDLLIGRDNAHVNVENNLNRHDDLYAEDHMNGADSVTGQHANGQDIPHAEDHFTGQVDTKSQHDSHGEYRINSEGNVHSEDHMNVEGHLNGQHDLHGNDHTNVEDYVNGRDNVDSWDRMNVEDNLNGQDDVHGDDHMNIEDNLNGQANVHGDDHMNIEDNLNGQDHVDSEDHMNVEDIQDNLHGNNHMNVEANLTRQNSLPCEGHLKGQDSLNVKPATDTTSLDGMQPVVSEEEGAAVENHAEQVPDNDIIMIDTDMAQLPHDAPRHRHPPEAEVEGPTTEGPVSRVNAKTVQADSIDVSNARALQPFPFETDFDLISPTKPRRRLVKKVSTTAKIKKAEAEQLAKAELARVNAELAKVSSMGGDEGAYDAGGNIQENTTGMGSLGMTRRPAVAASSMASASTMVAPALSNSGFSTSVNTVPRRSMPSASSPPHYSSAPRFSSSGKSRRTDVARLLDTLSNSKGSLVEPSRPNVVKLLRMFNLCDIGSSRPRPRATGPSHAPMEKPPVGGDVRVLSAHLGAGPMRMDARGLAESAGAAAGQEQNTGESNKDHEGEGLRSAGGPGLSHAEGEHAGNGPDQDQARLNSHPSPSPMPIKHDDAWSENKLEQKGDGGVEVCIGPPCDHTPHTAPAPSPSTPMPSDLAETTGAPPAQPADPTLTTSTSGTSDALMLGAGCEGHHRHDNQPVPNSIPATTTGTAASTLTAIGEGVVDVLMSRPGVHGEGQPGRGVAAGSEVGKSGVDVQEAPHVESSRLVQEEVGGPAGGDAQAMSARQSARMVDLSLLLDVILKTTASSARREFIKCGILSQLQAVIGRNFSREYYVILKKILRVVESLPVTADDVYSTRSAHGTFADVLRSITQNVLDKDVRERASTLLRKFPITAITDQQLLARVRQSKSHGAARNPRPRSRRFDPGFDTSKSDNKLSNAGKYDYGAATDKDYGHDNTTPGCGPLLNGGNRTGSPKNKSRRNSGNHGARSSPKGKGRQGSRASNQGLARIGPPVFGTGMDWNGFGAGMEWNGFGGGNSPGGITLPRNPTRPTKFSSTPLPAPSENQMAPKIVEGLEVPQPGDPQMTAEEVAGAIMRPRVLAPLITPWARPGLDLTPRNRTGRTMRPMTLKAGVPPHLPLNPLTGLPSGSPATNLPGTPAAGNGSAEGLVLTSTGLTYVPTSDHEDGSPTHTWADTIPALWQSAASTHLPPHNLQAPHLEPIPDAKRRRFEDTDIAPSIPTLQGSMPMAVISPSSLMYGPSTPVPIPANSMYMGPTLHSVHAAHPIMHLAQVSASLPHDQKPPVMLHQLDPSLSPPSSSLRTMTEGGAPISPLPPLPPEAPPELPPPPPPPPSLVPTPMGLQEIFATGVYGGWFPDRTASADDPDCSLSPRYSYSPLSPVPTSAPPPPSPALNDSTQPPHTARSIHADDPPNFSGFHPHKLLFSPSSTSQLAQPPSHHPSPPHNATPPTPPDFNATPVHSDSIPMDISDPHDFSHPTPTHNTTPTPATLPTAPLYMTANPICLPPPHISGSFPPQIIMSHPPMQMNHFHHSLPSGLSNPASLIPGGSLSLHSDLVFRPEHHVPGMGPIDPASIPSPEMSAVTEDEQYEAHAADGEVNSTPHLRMPAPSPAPHVLTGVVQTFGSAMDIDQNMLLHPAAIHGRGSQRGEQDTGINATPPIIPHSHPHVQRANGPVGAHPPSTFHNGHAAIGSHDLLSPSPFSPPPLSTTTSQPPATSPAISPTSAAHHTSVIPSHSTMYTPSTHNDPFPHPSPTFPTTETPAHQSQRDNPYSSRPTPVWQQHASSTEFPTSELYPRLNNPDLTNLPQDSWPYSSSPPTRDAARSPAPQWQGPQSGAGPPNSHDHLTPSKLPPPGHHLATNHPSDLHHPLSLTSQSATVPRSSTAAPLNDPPNNVQSTSDATPGGGAPSDAAGSGAAGLASYPNSWRDPSPEFEAFVTETVRHRLGKYTQPDHPSRISKDDATSLFRKIRKEIIEKERNAWQERSRQNIFKPIERAKLESNIKEFVRVYIRRLHTHK